MDSVYTKRYTSDVIPKALPPIVIPTTKLAMVQVPFPSDGVINRVVVEQFGGTPVAFTVRLFNSIVVLAPGNYPTAQALNHPNQYEITNAPLTGTAGNPAKLNDDNFGYPYRNQDGTPSDQQRYIYLLITPTSAGDDTTWHVTIQARIRSGE